MTFLTFRTVQILDLSHHFADASKISLNSENSHLTSASIE